MTESTVMPMAAPDADPLRALFERARNGDTSALDALCSTMRPRLYRTAWAVLRDSDEADDVAQEALVRAVTRRLLFLGRGSVAGWMTRIALNLARNRLRDVRRRSEILSQAQPHEQSARGASPSSVPAPDEIAEAHEMRMRMLAALDTLSERQREVVQLHAVAGLSFVEVADALHITHANARVTFSQAKQRLMSFFGSSTRGGSP